MKPGERCEKCGDEVIERAGEKICSCVAEKAEMIAVNTMIDAFLVLEHLYGKIDAIEVVREGPDVRVQVFQDKDPKVSLN